MPYEVIDSGTGRYEVIGDAPVSVKAGAELNSIPRQLGLTARYGIEGLANQAQVFTEPLRYLTDKFVPDRQLSLSDLVVGRTRPPKSLPLGVIASNFADTLGLPKPETANERVIGDASRLMAGTGLLGGAAKLASKVPGMVGQVGDLLSSNMGSQVSSAAGAGLAGGASREAGGSPLMQGVSAFFGGLTGGGVPSLLSGAVDKAKSVLNRLSPQDIDLRISTILQGQGIDFSQLPIAARNSLRNDLVSALQAGQELNPEAVRRLADFRAVGALPTRGMVTQNPVQITREQNLAKIGANQADEGLQGLAGLQNRNNATFIENLNRAGAQQGDPFRAGEQSISAIRGTDAALEQQVRSAYQAFRDSTGRDLPVPLGPLKQGYQATLNDFGDVIPGAVRKRFEEVLMPKAPHSHGAERPMDIRSLAIKSWDEPNVAPQPVLSIDDAERLIKTINRNFNPADLAQARALGELRGHVQNSIIGATETGAGMEAATLGNFARDAARQRFQWQESARPIETALNGAQPDKFIKQFVVGGSVADARAIAQSAPVEPVKNAILAHLKEKALAGAEDEVGKFSQSAYNKALREIGERKLSLFFSPEEIGQLQALGRVSSYATVQPVGSAVNNSNSGALVVGKFLDGLSRVAQSAPFVGPLAVQPVANGVNSLNIALRTRQAQNVLPGLLASTPKDPAGASLLLPMLTYSGGLLSAP